MGKRKKEIRMINITNPQSCQYGMPKQKKNRMKWQRLKRRLYVSALLLLICFGITKIHPLVVELLESREAKGLKAEAYSTDQLEREVFLAGQEDKSNYPTELINLLDKNPETLDYVKDYLNREEYKAQEIDLIDEYVMGEVPLLIQWDKRWGYNEYGQELIGLAGCGPTCLTMAYLYLTGDTAMNPRKMAEYAYNNGYYTTEGSSWSLWTEGTAGLGLSGYEISLDENVIKDHLDRGEVVVCSMAPGDFTATGHFILIRGYDENGFFVNDPNRRSNSDQQWDFDTLRYQIKCLWSIG